MAYVTSDVVSHQMWTASVIYSFKRARALDKFWGPSGYYGRRGLPYAMDVCI